MKTNNSNLEPNDDDKTQSINSNDKNNNDIGENTSKISPKDLEDAEKTKVDLEKTQFSPPSSKVSSTNDISNHNSDQVGPGKFENQPPSANIDDLHRVKSKESTKGVSKETFVAGVAGGAISGVAAGVAFSDEIKDIFAANSNKNEIGNGPNEELKEELKADVNDSSSLVDSLGKQEASGLSNEHNVETSFSDSIRVTAIDDSGYYEVRLTDTNSDGIIDLMDANAQLIDGTHLRIEATGDSIGHLLNGSSRIAEPYDYVSNQSAFDFFLTGSTINNQYGTYQIQYGDTLSEIADSNNTTIARLMEMNPDITDADLIMSGNNIVVPLNDNESNPYEGYQVTPMADTIGSDSPHTYIASSSDEIGSDSNSYYTSYSDTTELLEVNNLEGSDDSYSSAVENSDYASNLESTDFSEYNSTDSFYSLDSEFLF